MKGGVKVKERAKVGRNGGSFRVMWIAKLHLMSCFFLSLSVAFADFPRRVDKREDKTGKLNGIHEKVGEDERRMTRITRTMWARQKEGKEGKGSEAELRDNTAAHAAAVAACLSSC